MRRKLTDVFLETIKPPPSGRETYSDTSRPGLHLRVGQRKATWIYEKRIRRGPKRKETLGEYAVWDSAGRRVSVGMRLSEARDRAFELEALAIRGIDWVADAEARRLQAERAEAERLTLEEVFSRYEALKLSGLTTGADRSRDMRKALSAHLPHPISDLTQAHLQSVIDGKVTNGRLAFANRMRAYLRAFTRWAHGRNYLADDIGLKLDGSGPERHRDRTPTIEEVRRIYQATFALGAIWGPMFRLLVLTGQRRGEIAKLRWDNIDMDARTISLAGTQTKNRRPHVTHLSSPALAELRALAGDGEKRGFVFTTTGKTPVSGITKAKRRLDAEIGDSVAPWRLHDLRRSIATGLAQAGVPESIADRILNHAASGSAPSAVSRVYQQNDFLPERARALDKWAQLVTGEAATVVNLAVPGGENRESGV